jgi:hypothetical protein
VTRLVFLFVYQHRSACRSSRNVVLGEGKSFLLPSFALVSNFYPLVCRLLVRIHPPYYCIPPLSFRPLVRPQSLHYLTAHRLRPLDRTPYLVLRRQGTLELEPIQNLEELDITRLLGERQAE